MNMTQYRVSAAYPWDSIQWHTSFMKLIIFYLIFFIYPPKKKNPLYWLLFFLKGTITFALKKECTVLVTLKRMHQPYKHIFHSLVHTTPFPARLSSPPRPSTWLRTTTGHRAVEFGFGEGLKKRHPSSILPFCTLFISHKIPCPLLQTMHHL